jgi:small ligand-binding sensory domain FIST
MKWVSSASDHSDSLAAIAATSQRLWDELDQTPPDLLLCFASQHHLFHYGQMLPLLREKLRPRVLLGCSAGAVIGGGREIERRAGLALTAARLPQVAQRLLHVRHDQLPELDGSPTPWRELIGVDPAAGPQFLVLADPYSIDVARLLQGLDYAYPGAPKIGGLASGAQGPGSNALFADAKIEREGALILSLSGDIAIDTVVAQGCRPIGRPARVTRCDGHLLQELDGRDPVAFLSEMLAGLSPADQTLASRALFLGIVMSELRSEIGPGDFLVRNILGMHRESGTIAVGTQLRPGQTVQFHLRDGERAANDLGELLRAYRQRSATPPAGALLFSCLGRGESLFDVPDHDTQAFQSEVADVAVGGFFCNGEIGPVGGATYLHGYTSAFGIVRPRAARSATP